MTGTARKTAPRKAQPKKVAPAEVPDDPFDLASIFDTEHLDPLPIRLLGVRGNVLRDFTGQQVIEFSILGTQSDYAAMLDIITDVGDELWGKISSMATDKAIELLNKIVEMSGLYEGKLFAPLPRSVVETAGALPSQDSDATTS